MRGWLGSGALVLGFLVVGCLPTTLKWNSSASRSLVGRPALEIVGPDTEGAVLRLSDLRGQVVMLSFWHNS